MTIPTSFPRVAIFTEDCLNGSHGTGALLQRYLEGFPTTRLCNLYLRRRGVPDLSQSFEIPQLPLPATSLPPVSAWCTRIWNLVASRLAVGRFPMFERPPVIMPLRSSFDALSFVPDVIFTSAFSVSGLQVIPRLREAFPKVPIFQQFFDYFGSTRIAFAEALSSAVACCTRLTAVTPEIAVSVQRITGREVAVVPSFHLRLPDRVRIQREVSTDGLQAVVIGNFQNLRVLNSIRRVWAHCRSVVPGLQPLRWYCHESSFRSLESQLGTEIVWGGFHRGDAYLEELCKADLCVVPINSDVVARDDFARYSLPTRVTEPMAVGLPVVVLASPDTALTRYVRDHSVGFALSMDNPVRAAAGVLAILNDKAGREAVGLRALQHARDAFGIDAWKAEFWRTLKDMGHP